MLFTCVYIQLFVSSFLSFRFACLQFGLAYLSSHQLLMKGEEIIFYSKLMVPSHLKRNLFTYSCINSVGTYHWYQSQVIYGNQ